MEEIQSEFGRGRRGRNGTTDRKLRKEAQGWNVSGKKRSYWKSGFSSDSHKNMILGSSLNAVELFLPLMYLWQIWRFFTPCFPQLGTTGLFFLPPLYCYPVSISSLYIYQMFWDFFVKTKPTCFTADCVGSEQHHWSWKKSLEFPLLSDSMASREDFKRSGLVWFVVGFLFQQTPWLCFRPELVKENSCTL